METKKILKRKERVDNSEVFKYINDGWCKGTGLIWIHNILLKENKQIFEFELNKYIEEGWIKQLKHNLKK